MTEDEIKKLAEALQYREDEKYSIKQINKVLRNKSCARLIKEYKELMPEIQSKDRNKALLILVLSILCKNYSFLYKLQEVLLIEGLIPNLYGALNVLFSGKSSMFRLEIKLVDSQFPNRYEYLTRFWGQFEKQKIKEVLYAVKLLAMCDKTKFEELAFKDRTHLILLNMISFRLNEFPSDTLIMRLMKDGNELQANIGFYFAVSNITRDVYDYKQLRKKQNLIGSKTKRQIDKNMECHLEKFYSIYSCCSVERKVSLLVNYILSQKEYPVQFGYWLMESTLQEALIFEIISSNKIANLDNIYVLAGLIHTFPCKDGNGVYKRKDKLYAALVYVLKSFILEKKGIYSWNTLQKNLFQNICKIIPLRYLKRVYKLLEKESKNLMVSKLDEMVRFPIYLKDKKYWEIYQGMMDVINSCTIK